MATSPITFYSHNDITSREETLFVSSRNNGVILKLETDTFDPMEDVVNEHIHNAYLVTRYAFILKTMTPFKNGRDDGHIFKVTDIVKIYWYDGQLNKNGSRGYITFNFNMNNFVDGHLENSENSSELNEM